MSRDGRLWEHCGDPVPHAEHVHTVVMNEGRTPGITCPGTASVDTDDARTGASEGPGAPSGPAEATGGGGDLGDQVRAQVDAEAKGRGLREHLVLHDEARWVPASEHAQTHTYGEDGWRPAGSGEPHGHLVIDGEPGEESGEPDAPHWVDDDGPLFDTRTDGKPPGGDGLTAEDYNAPLVDGSRHPLHGVPQEVLDAARRATRAAAECRDVEPSQADAIADAVLTDAMHALRAWLGGPPVVVDGLSDLHRRAADRLVDDAQRREAARALRDLLHQAEVWADVVKESVDPDDALLHAAIRRVQRARARVVPSWALADDEPMCGVSWPTELTTLVQRLRNETARAARMLHSDLGGVRDAVAQVDATHSELCAGIEALERRCEEARASAAGEEARWRSRIAREVYERAERLEREPENRSLDVALAAIVRTVGDEVGRIPTRNEGKST